MLDPAPFGVIQHSFSKSKRGAARCAVIHRDSCSIQAPGVRVMSLLPKLCAENARTPHLAALRWRALPPVAQAVLGFGREHPPQSTADLTIGLCPIAHRRRRQTDGGLPPASLDATLPARRAGFAGQVARSGRTTRRAWWDAAYIRERRSPNALVQA